MSSRNGRHVAALGGLALAVLVGGYAIAQNQAEAESQESAQTQQGAASPRQAISPVGKPPTKYQPDCAYPKDGAEYGLCLEREVTAATVRSTGYSRLQAIFAFAAVIFAGWAAVAASKAAHWAREAAVAATASAKADNDALTETRNAAAAARQDAVEQGVRFDKQMATSKELIEWTAKTAHAMDHAAVAMRRAGTAARAQADAIARQADAAADTARKQLQAYVYAEAMRIQWIPDGYPLFKITLRNTGQTPATDVRFGARITFGDAKQLAVFKIPSDVLIIGSHLIGAGQPEEATLLVADYEAIRREQITPQRMMAVFGRIEYGDVFGRRHETEFAFFTTGPDVEPGRLNCPRAMFRETGEAQQPG